MSRTHLHTSPQSGLTAPEQTALKSGLVWSSVLLSALALAILLGMASCSSSKATDEAKAETKQVAPASTEVIPVQVLKAEPTKSSQRIIATGQFTTDDESMLSFKIGGVVQQVLVKEGDAIRQGQVLARLDPTEIDAQVKQAEQGLAKAKRDAARAAALYKDSVATLEQLQNAETQLEVAQQQLRTALFNRQYAEIRAVTSGLVLRKMVNEGQVVSTGAPVLQTNGAGQTTWRLRIGLSDKDWGLLQLGDSATITVDALPDAKLIGTITRKAEQADPYTGALNVEITLRSIPANCKLASGLYGKAVISPSRQQLAVALPYQAIMDGDASTGFVFTVVEGKAHKVPVTLSGLGEKTILVGGLEAGTPVVVQGSAYLQEGSLVKILNN